MLMVDNLMTCASRLPARQTVGGNPVGAVMPRSDDRTATASSSRAGARFVPPPSYVMPRASRPRRSLAGIRMGGADSVLQWTGAATSHGRMKAARGRLPVASSTAHAGDRTRALFLVLPTAIANEPEATEQLYRGSRPPSSRTRYGRGSAVDIDELGEQACQYRVRHQPRGHAPLHRAPAGVRGRLRQSRGPIHHFYGPAAIDMNRARVCTS